MERLREHVARRNAGGAVLVDEALRELLARDAVERQPHGRFFELRGHANAEALEERDALGVLSRVPTREPGAEIGTRRAARSDELLDGLRRGIERIDLAAQRLELGQRELARAAFGAGGPAHGAVRVEPRRRERLDARARERRQQDVRRRREVVLRMPANELEVFRERHVAFERAGAHAVGGLVRFERVLRQHEARAAMADRERRAPRRLVEASLQARLQLAVAHIRDEERGPRPELDARLDGLRARGGRKTQRDGEQHWHRRFHSLKVASASQDCEEAACAAAR